MIYFKIRAFRFAKSNLQEFLCKKWNKKKRKIEKNYAANNDNIIWLFCFKFKKSNNTRQQIQSVINNWPIIVYIRFKYIHERITASLIDWDGYIERCYTSATFGVWRGKTRRRLCRPNQLQVHSGRACYICNYCYESSVWYEANTLLGARLFYT